MAELAGIIAENDGSLGQALEELRQDFNDTLPQDAAAQARDVSRRCALIALAGELATGWGILPWQKGEARRAAKQVLAWWLERRGGAGSNEVDQAVRAIRSFVTEYAPSRLVTLESRKSAGQAGPPRWAEKYPERFVASRMGWHRQNSDGETKDFLITGDAWAKICTEAGVDPVATAKRLIEAGHVQPGEKKNLMAKVTVPGMPQMRCYVVLPSILEDKEVGTVLDANTLLEPEAPK